MNPIEELVQIDIITFLLTAFVIISAVVAIVTMIGKFCNIIGKPLKWFNKQNQDHELLITTANTLNALQQKHEEDTKQSIRHDDMIRDDLKKLTDMFIDKEINDFRWEIINFATKVSEGKPCNKDSYKHCLRTYEKYEKLLEEHGLENGEVEISMEIVNESYKEKMKNGF